MVLLGAMPPGRKTEQHDIFFGIADALSALKEDMIASWPEADGKLHIDAWREVTNVDGYSITVHDASPSPDNSSVQLFFINLGGYKKDEFDEFHYKLLAVANDKAGAITEAKKTAFYKHTGFKGAESHVDDKYGIDIDDAYAIEDILLAKFKEKYSLRFTPAAGQPEDTFHLGYVKMNSL